MGRTLICRHLAGAIVLLLSLSSGCTTFERHPEREPFTRYVPAGGGMAPSMVGWASPTIAENGGETNMAPGSADGERRLRNGDRVIVQLRGITPPVEITDEIDDTGTVNLDHIGQVVIAGLTTSEAERRIESAYIVGQFYKKINVTVVAERDEFYVRGEVRNPGRFPLSRGMTLTMAIATAGGYTDYAKRSSISIKRGQQIVTVDATKVDKLQAPDPLIQRGDTITVNTRAF
jgi:protein involved in polysaccharide export with SLBB domain